MQLTLLHFNDLHGRLDQCPPLFTLIQRIRAEAQAAGRTVLVLDGGDSSDRARWDSDITKGRANFKLLEAMGVQASVVGNGEALQWGRTALRNLVASAQFPVLAANLVDSADPAQLAVPGLKRSCVLNLDGCKIGVVGVTAVYRNGYDRFGYRSADPLPPLQREVAALKAGGADFIILLSHLGYAPPEEKQKWLNPNDFTDDIAAAACPEINLVVGGHSHRKLEPPLRVGNTLIVQAGDYGRWLGQLDLTVEAGRITDHTYILHSTDDVPPDPTLAATLATLREEADSILQTKIGEAAVEFPHQFDQPSPFSNRVADALREICNAELAIFYSGYAHRGLAAGPITRRDLYQALPGSGHVTAAEVSGAQIQRMVSRMLASPYRTQSANPHRNEPPLGLPACSRNVQLNYDVTREPGNQLLDILVDGCPVDPARHYRLASTYYTLNDIADEEEYDYIGLQPGQTIELVRVEEVLWEIMEDWVKANSPLQP